MYPMIAAKLSTEEDHLDVAFDEHNILEERDYKLCALLYCVDRLRQTYYASDFYDVKIDAVGGLEPYGDVVFKATEKRPCRERKIAIQVKHSNDVSRKIDERYLCCDSRTYLFKCFEHCKNAADVDALRRCEQVILWTNMPIAASVRDWFEDYVHDPGTSVRNRLEGMFPQNPLKDILGTGDSGGISYKRYRISKNHKQDILHKCLNQLRKRRKESASRTGKEDYFYEPTEAELQHFLAQLVFYVNAPKVSEMQGKLLNITGNYFYYYYELVEAFACKGLKSDQIKHLITLAEFRNTLETGPYAKLIFNDLDELKYKLWTWFHCCKNNHLSIKASLDVDCTVVRLITALKGLGFPRKCCLAVNHYSFCYNKQDFERIISGNILKCTIISSISEAEISSIKESVAQSKVIFVGNNLNCDFDDHFDVNCLDNESKNLIKSRKVKLSQQQCATAHEIFGDKLLQKNNYSTALELYRLSKDSVLQITADDPLVDVHYQPRSIILSSAQNSSVKIDLLNQTDFRNLIIHGQPGMGKTTEMVKFCSEFKAKYQDHLVVYLHCVDAVFRWRGCAEDLIRSTVKPCSDLTNRLLQQMIKLGKVILLLDGYDEVSQQHNHILRRLVSEISHVKMFKLYIASGSQRKDEIIDILGECGLCNLEPFSEDDQLAYLKKVWNIEGNDDTIIGTNARSSIHTLMVNNSFIEKPLQMQMIASIYKDRILSPDLQVYEDHSLGSMYKDFIEHKFMEHVKRNDKDFRPIKSLREAFLHDHAIAASEIFHSGNLTKIESRNFETNGLMLINPKATFIHYTYMEYFLALHLLTFSNEISQIDYFLNLFLDSTDNSVFYFVDYLLKIINPKTPLYKFTRKPVVDYTPPKTSLLHPDKMIEFYVTLYHWDPARINLLLSRLLFDRMFNLLEVIYDSLRIEIISQPQFSENLLCCHKSNDMFLSRREFKSVDILNPLLKILVKKHPDTFVTMCLTPLEDHDNSLLELMCDPGYLELFDWFTEIVPELYDEQRTALKGFIRNRLEKCLRGLIDFNNVLLPNKICCWIKNTWTVESTRRFLTKNNLLVLFANYIEYWQNCFDEPRRIEMVHLAFDLYRWAFNEQIPLDEEFLVAIQTIRKDSIRNAFQTSFLSELTKDEI